MSLPDLPDWARQGFFWTGVAYNAIWWGFIQPRIAGHVKTIEQKGNT